MTQWYSKLSPRDCPSKHAVRDNILWQVVLSALLHCLPLVSIPLTKQDVRGINSRALITPYDVLIKLPSIAIPKDLM